jgi:hypothetical protein
VVGALLAASLVTSKLWSALSHPPGRHPIAIVVRALSARLNRVLKTGDFRVQYFAAGGLGPVAHRKWRALHVSEGHRRQYRAQAWEEGVGVVGLAVRARTAVILHTVPRWGTAPYRKLMGEELRVPDAMWKLFDPTRRGYFCLPVFVIRRRAGKESLEVVGVLSVDSRLPDAFLKSDVQRAIRDYAAVIQDVHEPVHGSQIREIAAGGAAPLETILINGQEPRVPPLLSTASFTAKKTGREADSGPGSAAE